MGSGGVAIAALPTVICFKVTFSDGLGGEGYAHRTGNLPLYLIYNMRVRA